MENAPLLLYGTKLLNDFILVQMDSFSAEATKLWRLFVNHCNGL